LIRRAATLLAWGLLGLGVGWAARAVMERHDDARTIESAASVEPAVLPSPDTRAANARSALTAPLPLTAGGPLRNRAVQTAYTAPSSPAEFRQRLDEIATLARSGDTRAAMTMWRFLSRCGGESRPSVAGVQERYEHDRQFNAVNAESRRAAALDEVAMCRSVGWRPLDALGWLEYALAAGDENAAFAALHAHQALSLEEATRYAERLAVVIAAGSAALGQRLAQGDTRALSALANAHQSGALAHDPVRIFAYRFAQTLTPAAPNEWRPDVERLGKDLTLEQIEEGTRLGQEIFESCCQTD